jgi:hypothetical protein
MLSTQPLDLAKPDDRDPRDTRSMLWIGSLAILLLVDSLFAGFVLPQAPRRIAELGDNKFPARMLLNIVLADLGGDSPVANLLLYRLVFMLSNLANLALLAQILQAVQPRRVLAGLVLYAWNPIVIPQGQGKVDTMMVFFLPRAALALVRDRRKLAAVAPGASVLVKWHAPSLRR